MNEFMPTVRKLLRNYSIDPCKMVFEITERDTVKNLDIDSEKHDPGPQERRVPVRDRRFRRRLFFISIYQGFHIDFIKVDGEFIRNMSGTNTLEKAIVSSIASLAPELGIKTIAEFVGTAEIFREVQLAGIDYAQGYYIKKPSPDIG